MEGAIPPELGKLKRLVGIWIQSNALEGSIPEEFGNFGELRYFWAYNNKLSGGIPEMVAWLPKLVEIKVDREVLEESSAEVLAHLKQHLNCLTC